MWGQFDEGRVNTLEADISAQQPRHGILRCGADGLHPLLLHYPVKQVAEHYECVQSWLETETKQ